MTSTKHDEPVRLTEPEEPVRLTDHEEATRLQQPQVPYYLQRIPRRRGQILYGGESLTGPDPASLTACIATLRAALGLES